MIRAFFYADSRLFDRRSTRIADWSPHERHLSRRIHHETHGSARAMLSLCYIHWRYHGGAMRQQAALDRRIV